MSKCRTCGIHSAMQSPPEEAEVEVGGNGGSGQGATPAAGHKMALCIYFSAAWQRSKWDKWQQHPQQKKAQTMEQWRGRWGEGQRQNANANGVRKAGCAGPRGWTKKEEGEMQSVCCAATRFVGWVLHYLVIYVATFSQPHWCCRGAAQERKRRLTGSIFVTSAQVSRFTVPPNGGRGQGARRSSTDDWPPAGGKRVRKLKAPYVSGFVSIFIFLRDILLADGLELINSCFKIDNF